MFKVIVSLVLASSCITPCPPPKHTVEYKWIDPPKFSFLSCVETIPGSPVPGFVGRVLARVPPTEWRVTDGGTAINIDEKWLVERKRPGDVCRRGD